MAIVLDLTDEEFTMLWCRANRSEEGWNNADNDYLRVHFGSYLQYTLTLINEASERRLQGDGVPLDLTDHQASRLRQKGARASDLWKEALEQGDRQKAQRAFDGMLETFHSIVAAAPDELDPGDNNETPKP